MEKKHIALLVMIITFGFLILAGALSAGNNFQKKINHRNALYEQYTVYDSWDVAPKQETRKPLKPVDQYLHYTADFNSPESRCLALNLYNEAENQGFEGMLAVAYIVFNRMESKRYPDDLCEVVYQRAQFSWTLNGEPKLPDLNNPIEKKAWNMAVFISNYLLSGGELKNPVGDATHYYADYISQPKWAKKMEFVAQVKTHKFYRM